MEVCLHKSLGPEAVLSLKPGRYNIVDKHLILTTTAFFSLASLELMSA